MERLRSITVTIEVDTNKRTETVALNLDDYDDTDALVEGVRGALGGILGGIG